MIAKIGRGESLYGALSYNTQKVDQENGQVLMLHKVLEILDGRYSILQLSSSFEPYLVANRNTEKPVLHISLNPDPNDRVSNEKFRLIALQYMREMGYGDQPFIVFKHTDTLRTHIHIVSVCVDQEGRKISDQFEKRRSMAICRELERKYGLIPATGKEIDRDHQIFQPVDYHKGDLKSQISAVVRHLPTYYRFHSLGEYNALLSLFNITTEKVEGELRGQMKQGLVYCALDEKGKKTGPPFKASLFGKNAGLKTLDTHFQNSRESLKESNIRLSVSAAAREAMDSTDTEQDFRKILSQRGINLVIRRNDSGRIYGVTFIDHHSKTVWNGSRLGKELSANQFNDVWLNDPKVSTSSPDKSTTGTSSEETLQDEKAHDLFDFIESGHHGIFDDSPGFISISGSFFAEGRSEEPKQALQKKKKKKKRRSND